MDLSAGIPVAVYARVPEPGSVKTRLSEAIGAAAATDLYRAFLADTLACCDAAGLPTEVWVAGDPIAPSLRRLTGDRRCVAQPEGDLGDRMAVTLQAMVERSGGGLLVGSDAPTLPSFALRRAAGALERADLVLGPAADGGYYLVGARRRCASVFQGVRWSSPDARADTLAGARRFHLSVELLPPWYDVDTDADLRLLRAHLALRPAAAPATAEALKALWP